MCSSLIKEGKKKDMEKSKFIIVLILLLPYVNATSSGPKEPNKHFVLVHGACHGAWSWYKIVPLIKSSGHNVTAIDLGASGINPKHVLEIPRLFDYFSPLMDFLNSLPAHEKVVLVGHSLGGFAISRAMESFPQKILVAIFVTAGMPGPILNATTIYSKGNKLVADQLDNRVTYDYGPDNPPTTFNFGPKYLASNLYQLSSSEDWALVTMLVRPRYLYNLENISKEMVLSTKRYGSVRRAFVVAGEDKQLKKEFQQWMIARNPPDEVKEIPDADHMVMMSRPLQLFTLLLRIVHE